MSARSKLLRDLSRFRPALVALVALLLLCIVPALALGALGGDSSNRPAASAAGCLGLKADLVGTPGNDLLRGGPGNDVIVGLGGDDRIVGGGGSDVICGGSGDDVITTGKGADKIVGGPGDDRIFARRGRDLIYGQQGADLINGGPNFDRCLGGSGKDLERNCEAEAPPLKREGEKGCRGTGSCMGRNLAPGAVGDSPTTDEDTAMTIEVLANDTDPDGDRLTVATLDTTGTRGAAAISSGGTAVTFDPRGRFEELQSGQSLDDSFAYTVSDGHGHSATATVVVAVSGVDDPPGAVTDSAWLRENDPAVHIDVLANDTDVDGGPKTVYSTTDGAYGTVTITAGGGGVDYRPAAGYCGDDSFTYTLNGGSTATVSVKVECVHYPPTGLSLSGSSLRENEAAGAVVGTFSTTDEDAGDNFTYRLVAGEGSSDNGSFEISADKLKAKESFNYEAKSSYSIRVRTTGTGGKLLEKQLTITIIDVNDAPKTVPDTYSGAVGNTTAVLGNSASEPNVTLSGMSGNVPSANDSDEDAGDTISVVAETVTTTGGGSAAIDPDGTFTYEPRVGDKNQTDSFIYHVTDGEATTAGSVSVEIEDTMVWYVDGAAASAGDGRSATPYKTLSEINGAGGSGDADGTGDYIFLNGSNTYAGGLPLEANQELIGSPAGLSVPNHPNLVAASGTNPVVTNAGGDAIALAGGSELQRVNASDASGVGIRGTSVTTATVGSNTTVSGNTGGGIVLSGAAGGEISIGSTIKDQLGTVVSVANRSSGTVTLSGDITSSDGGVSASGNTGAHVAYTGTLDLTRSSGEAFTATSGGGVVATGSGNELTTMSGTALRVANTTIDSGGVNFQSVSASDAPGGIVLENTGSTAGLTVSGTGGTGSGGTITASTGPGILLSSTSDVSLASVKVTDGGDDGIRGSDVNGFSLTGSSEVTGNGDAATEDGLSFTNLTGTVNLTNATVSDSADRNVAVVNESGTVTATFSGGTYSNTDNSPFGGDAIFFEGTGTGTIGVKVENATFTNNSGDHVRVTTDAANSVAENVTISGNTMSNTIGQSGGGVTLSPGGNATMQASVLNNTITGADIEAITVDTPGTQSSPQPAQVNVTINGNTIGSSGIDRSGSSTGNDIGVRSNGAATVNALITNNTLFQYAYDTGLQLVQNDGSGTLDATVRGNTISRPGALEATVSPQFGMHVTIGSLSSDRGVSCLDIGGTGAQANNLTNSAGAATPNLRFSMDGEATARLAGYVGGAHDNAAVNAYLAARNIAPDGVSSTQFDAASNYAQAASCPLP